MEYLFAALAVILGLLIASPAAAEPPSRPIRNFEAAKVVARDAIYADRATDIYCGCAYRPTGRSGGAISASSCGYKPRANAARGKRLEWEHVMPAWFFGYARACWKTGLAQCVKDGKRFKGRECCAKADAKFRRMEADLHNLAPSVGELNGDRSNHPYGLVAGEPRAYGACDFEMGSGPKRAEPPTEVRGDVARVWFYMVETYSLPISAAQREMLTRWSQDDPVDEWERLRDERVEAAQGNRNRFVRP